VVVGDRLEPGAILLLGRLGPSGPLHWTSRHVGHDDPVGGVGSFEAREPYSPAALRLGHVVQGDAHPPGAVRGECPASVVEAGVRQLEGGRSHGVAEAVIISAARGNGTATCFGDDMARPVDEPERLARLRANTLRPLGRRCLLDGYRGETEHAGEAGGPADVAAAQGIAHVVEPVGIFDREVRAKSTVSAWRS
jgi:hypothetical protein